MCPLKSKMPSSPDTMIGLISSSQLISLLPYILYSSWSFYFLLAYAGGLLMLPLLLAVVFLEKFWLDEGEAFLVLSAFVYYTYEF